ncbi:hypothetical protein GCM10020295_44080 [Streptomyces cinereospinus]
MTSPGAVSTSYWFRPVPVAIVVCGVDGGSGRRSPACTTGTGRFTARVKLYDDGKTYQKIVGAGGLSGDGAGDPVTQDAANVPYGHHGTGTFAARVKPASGRGAADNAVVGAGGIPGGGRADWSRATPQGRCTGCRGRARAPSGGAGEDRDGLAGVQGPVLALPVTCVTPSVRESLGGHDR